MAKSMLMESKRTYEILNNKKNLTKISVLNLIASNKITIEFKKDLTKSKL